MPDGNTLISTMLAEVPTDLPEGIRSFLDTAIPPLTATPGAYDADHPTQNSETLAHNLNTIFKAFEGLTLAAIPMYIGQLNTVNQGLLLASLEYREESQAVKEFVIIEPEAETVYYPGEMRITAKAANSTEIEAMTGAIGEDTFDMIFREGVWRQYIEMMENGEYTLTLTATFPEGDPVSQTVDFRIGDAEEDEPEPPGGADLDALEDAYNDLATALKALFDIPIGSLSDIIAYLQAHLNVVKTALLTLLDIAKQVASGDIGGAIDQLVSELLNYWGVLWDYVSSFDDAFTDGEFTGWDLLTTMSETLRNFAAGVTTLYSMIKGLLKDEE